jgi:heavy metal-binding protein
MTRARSRQRWARARWALSLSLACTPTHLEVDAQHPAQPGARVEPLPKVGAALAQDFDPLAPSSAAPPTSGPAEHAHGTANHEHEHEHDTAAPNTAVPASSEPSTSAPAGVTSQWTCPMHPEIVRPEPGKCPICGMQLVPLKAPPGDKAGTP